MPITTDFDGTETTAVVVSRLTEIAEFYAGEGATANATKFGDVIDILNLFAAEGETIENGEAATAFIDELNALNNPDLDLYLYEIEEGEPVLEYESGPWILNVEIG